MFTSPRTIYYSRFGPQAQYIYIYIYIDNELLGPTPLHYQLSHIQINFFFQGNSMVLKTESIKIQKKGLVFSFYGLNHHLLPF